MPRTHVQTLKHIHPNLTTPIIISAPIRPFALSSLATAVSAAGGLGFISSTASDANELSQARKALLPSSPPLPDLPLPPISSTSPHPPDTDLSPLLTALHKTPLPETPFPAGIGYQIYGTPLAPALTHIRHFLPRAVWLFAWTSPSQLGLWARSIAAATSSRTKIYIQVGSVRTGLEACSAVLSPNKPGKPGYEGLYPVSSEGLVLVAQGADAGGHQLARGASVVSLVPELLDALREKGWGHVPVLAAGGIADARGAAGALALGAAGVVLGTRLVGAEELAVPEGFRKFVLESKDGGESTVATRLFDRLRGTGDFPEGWNGRALVNRSVREVEGGVGEDEVGRKYGDVVKRMGLGKAEGDEEAYGKEGRLVTYAGTAVGLVREVKPVKEILEEIRGGVREILEAAVRGLDQ